MPNPTYWLVDFNPYKPCVLFMGHGQKVQNQIRRHKNAASEQDLHCLLIEVSFKFDKSEKYHPTTLKLEMDSVQLIRMVKYIMHKWV